MNVEIYGEWEEEKQYEEKIANKLNTTLETLRLKQKQKHFDWNNIYIYYSSRRNEPRDFNNDAKLFL